MISFVLDVSLELEDLSFPSRDLVSESCDLDLHVVVGSALIIKVESRIVALFLESMQRNAIRVMPSFKLVILHEFFILQMSEFCLNRVKLVSQRKVVFVSLLNLKNLSFELADKEVLLVAGEVDTVIVLCGKQRVYS